MVLNTDCPGASPEEGAWSSRKKSGLERFLGAMNVWVES